MSDFEPPVHQFERLVIAPLRWLGAMLVRAISQSGLQGINLKGSIRQAEVDERIREL